jgi:hypothetical protein
MGKVNVLQDMVHIFVDMVMYLKSRYKDHGHATYIIGHGTIFQGMVNVSHSMMMSLWT